MRKEAEAHAEEDRVRKELIEARNAADNSAYTAEKTLRDFGDKVPAELKTQVEEAVTKVREVMTNEDVEAMRKETDSLNQLIQQIGAAAYQQTAQQEASTEGQPGGEAAGEASASPEADGGEDVVDGEFRNV